MGQIQTNLEIKDHEFISSRLNIKNFIKDCLWNANVLDDIYLLRASIDALILHYQASKQIEVIFDYDYDRITVTDIEESFVLTIRPI